MQERMPPTFLAGFNTPAQFIINSTALHITVNLPLIIVYLDKLKCPASFRIIRWPAQRKTEIWKKVINKIISNQNLINQKFKIKHQLVLFLHSISYKISDLGRKNAANISGRFQYHCTIHHKIKK